MEKCSPVVQSTSMDILSKLKVPFPYIFIAYLVSKLLTYWFKYCFLNYLKTFNRNELPSARLHRPLSSTWLRKEIASKVVSHHTLPGAGYEIYNMPCLSLITRANFLIRLDIILILINHQIPVEKIESSKRSKNQTVPGANYCILTFSSWDFLADEASWHMAGVENFFPGGGINLLSRWGLSTWWDLDPLCLHLPLLVNITNNVLNIIIFEQ